MNSSVPKECGRIHFLAPGSLSISAVFHLIGQQQVTVLESACCRKTISGTDSDKVLYPVIRGRVGGVDKVKD
jgi:hypothetical protein